MTVRKREKFIQQVMALTPGPKFRPVDGLIDRISAAYVESNARLVDRLPADSGWQEWLAQPPSVGADNSLERISIRRVRQLMQEIDASEFGPVAWVQPYGYRLTVRRAITRRLPTAG